MQDLADTAVAQLDELGAEAITLRRAVELTAPGIASVPELQLGTDASVGETALELQRGVGDPMPLSGKLPAGLALTIGAEMVVLAAAAEVEASQLAVQLVGALQGAHVAGASVDVPSSLAIDLRALRIDASPHSPGADLLPAGQFAVRLARVLLPAGVEVEPGDVIEAADWKGSVTRQPIIRAGRVHLVVEGL
jgi:hypothetical protein